MNIKIIILILVILGISTIYYFMPKNMYLSPREFQYEYEQSKIIHTMKLYTDMYVKDKYVYLVKKEMTIFNIWKKITVYTELDGVNNEIKLELKQND